MDTNLVLVLLLAPFLGFLFNVFLGKKVGKSIVGIVGTLSVAVSFAVTLYLFASASQEPVVINLFD
jgi:NADH-quinone oxidoreductase subunit L